MSKYHKNVIPFRSVADNTWRVFDWCKGDSNPIEIWRNGLSDDGQELFDGLFKNNRKIDNPKNWVGFKRYMSGKLLAERIFELQFFADKRQHRLLCKCGDKRKHLIILIGCYHKMDSYTPREALDTAILRSKSIGRIGIHLHERQSEEDL